ncbi:hypothetical protein ABT052_47175, partial [Streptomyces sp. NPDC002766]
NCYEEGDLTVPFGGMKQSGNGRDKSAHALEKAGITVHEDFDGEFAAKVRTGRYEWTRMAGIQLGGPANT